MGIIDSIAQKTDDFVNALTGSFDEEHRLQVQHDKLKAQLEKKNRIKKLKEETDKIRSELGKS